MCAANNNIAVYSTYIPGVQNEIADNLSRFQMDRFCRQKTTGSFKTK